MVRVRQVPDISAGMKSCAVCGKPTGLTVAGGQGVTVYHASCAHAAELDHGPSK